MLMYFFTIYLFLWQGVPQLDYPLQEDPPLVCSEPEFSYTDLPKAA